MIKSIYIQEQVFGFKAIDATSINHQSARVWFKLLVSVYHLLQKDLVHWLYMHCLFGACMLVIEFK